MRFAVLGVTIFMVGACSQQDHPPEPEVAVAKGPPLVRPSNPFDEPGEAGIGRGWVVRQAKHLSGAIHLDAGALVFEAPAGQPDQVVVACQAENTPVAGRSWVMGEWRLEGVTAPRKWQGARLMLLFYDAQGKKLEGEDGNRIYAQAQGSIGWTNVGGAYPVPEGAVSARLCAGLHAASTGKMWIRGLSFLQTPPNPTSTGKNVLFVVIDALRAESLGLYGEERPVSPRIDALAAESLVFRKTWTQYTWTVPSYVSYMSSEYARTHGWTYGIDKATETGFELGEDIHTLASVLQESGYATIGYFSNVYLKMARGMGRGFYAWEWGDDARTTERVIADIAEWPNDSMPNFLYVHLMGPHSPLCPDEAALNALDIHLPERLLQTPPTAKCPHGGVVHYDQYNGIQIPKEEVDEWNRLAYLGEVRVADGRVGQMLDALDANGVRDDTIIVLTSDHGELLGEHDQFGHASFIWEELTSVPLLISGPGITPGWEETRLAQLIDVAPTLLELLDLQSLQPESWQGRCLLHPQPASLVVTQRDDKTAFTRDGRLKLVRVRWQDKMHEVYDLIADPDEQTSLQEAPPEGALALDEEADLWFQQHPEPQHKGRQIALTADERLQNEQNLRALGYIE